MEDFDNFQLSNATLPVSTPPTSLPTPPQAPSTPFGLMTPGFNPMSYLNPSPVGTNDTSPFLPNVKLDVKQYPVFSGENAAWSKFKRGVTLLASTHGLEDIFDPNYTVPLAGDPD